MPSIQTLVADLNNPGSSIQGIGKKPDVAVTNLESEISATCRVKHNFVHMKAFLTESNVLSCQEVAATPLFNGTYIHFEDDWSTVGTMDVNRLLAASGNFSGCAYKIYRSELAVYKCVHISRPAKRGDALVELMDKYARQSGWTEIQSIPTAGLIGKNGCQEVFVVFQRFLNQRMDTIRLELNGQGKIVGRTFYSAPF